jgi:predicted enzyme related to lactoylglutathione lyase
MHLYRVILPVSNITTAAAFYSALFQSPGTRVSPGRQYFQCGPVILACFDPSADGDPFDPLPNPGHLYFSVPDLDSLHTRAQSLPFHQLDPQIQTQPPGERSFYAQDPFQNPLCFVDHQTLFTGSLTP